MKRFSGSGQTILVVDDLIENTEVLRAFLLPLGLAVRTTLCGEEALAMVAESPPDAILLDLMMPGLDGVEVCRRLKRDPKTRHIPVIIITGNSDRESNVRALEAGADDFVSKPFDRVLLEARLASSLKTKQLQDDLLHYQQDLESQVEARTMEVRRTQQITVFALAKLAESRDNETGDHLERMRAYAQLLAGELSTWDKFSDQISPEFLEQLYQSTPLHDIGKVGIPDAILLKPGKLTPEEFEIMKAHAVVGGDTLKAADQEAGKDSFLAMGRDIAYFHHEKWDGSGYPHGIGGDSIPLPARIAALADVYDALSSKRPYKEPFSHEKSREIILAGNGSHFDPDVVQAFLKKESAFVEIRDLFQGSGEPSPIQAMVEAAERAHAAD
jgi:putative two-component system response regulator